MSVESLEDLLSNALGGVVAGHVIKKVAQEVWAWSIAHICKNDQALHILGLILKDATNMGLQLEALKIQLEG